MVSFYFFFLLNYYEAMFSGHSKLLEKTQTYTEHASTFDQGHIFKGAISLELDRWLIIKTYKFRAIKWLCYKPRGGQIQCWTHLKMDG